LSHAFEQVDQVLFFVGPQNIRSQKAMLKIGGRPLGPVTRISTDGIERTNLVYQIDKNTKQNADTAGGGEDVKI